MSFKKITTKLVASKRLILNFTLVVLIFQSFLLLSWNIKPIKVEAATASISVTDDVVVVSNQNYNQKFRDHLGAGNAYYDGALGKGASLIKFNGLSLPAGAIVTNANLVLKQYSHSIIGASNPVLYASRPTSDWNPNTVRWNIQPGYADNGPAVGVAAGVREFNLNVTGIVQSWASGSANYGIAVRSDSTANGSWICSIREQGVGGSSQCNGFRTRVDITYIINSAPYQPVLDSSFLSSNDAHGGQPYVGGIVRENNPLDPNDDLKQNCVVNSGCNVRVRFTNFGDADAAPGHYNYSDIVYEATVPPGGSSVVGSTQVVNHPSTAEYNQSTFIPDGYYRVYARSVDYLGYWSFSNVVNLKVDTTAPIPAIVVDLNEYSKGDQLLVNANNTGDTNGLSNPVKYDFCRTEGVDPGLATPFNGGTLATPTDSDFVHCSTTGASGMTGGGTTGMWQDSAFFGFGQLEDGKKYFFSVRNKDSVDPSKPDRANIGIFSTPKATIMDATEPVISSAILEDFSGDVTSSRISPTNLDGVKDDVKVKWSVEEANLNEVFYELKNVQTGTIAGKISVFDFGASLDQSTATTGINKSFNNLFAGLNETSTAIADGVYQVVISATDKAGNVVTDSSLVINIDNTPGNINISTPPQNSFVNTDQVTVSGQVYSQDLVTLKECKVVSGNCALQDLSFFNLVNEDYFFTKQYNLDLGENNFRFQSTDSVLNIQEKDLQITREEEKPEVTKITLDTTNVDLAGSEILSKNRKPVISFDLEDSNSQNNGLSGLDGNSINLKLVNTNNDQISLVLNGQNDSSLGSFNSTCADVNNGVGFFVTGLDNCSINYTFNNDLQPDGKWKFVLDFKDKAGNSNSSDGTVFDLDSFTFLENSVPGQNAIFARKKVVFEGKGEKGATLQLTNSQLQALGLDSATYGVKIILDESNNASSGKDLNGDDITILEDSYVQSGFEIVCDSELDFDNSNLTTNPVCTWKVSLLQSSSLDALSPNVINQNQITITDPIGNTLTQTKTINVNLFSVDLSWTASNSAGKQYGTKFISTDGNGRQDGIYFEGATSNPNNSGDPVLVDVWKWEVKDENGVVVRTISGSGSLPPVTIFDGKDDNDQWLMDGNYTWTLDLDTVDNSAIPVINGSFQNITSDTPGVFITYPSGESANNPFITSSGATEVQGQANLFAGTTPEGLEVTICVDTIGLPASCDFEQKVAVDVSGFFSSILPLPRISSDPLNPGVTNHILKATVVDKFGNQGQPSNLVYVRNNPIDPFIEVKIIPTYSGINTPAIISEIEALKTSWEAETDPVTKEAIKLELQNKLDFARNLIIRSRVTSDTQYVKLKYNNLSNLNELSGNLVSKNIGWIDDTTFDYTKHILGSVPVDGNGDPQTSRCTTVECTWDVLYPTPALGGGLYTIDFTGRKGSIEQTMSAPFWIDANVLSAPLIYDINKIISGQSQDTKIYDNQYYSNSNVVQIKGVADPLTDISIIDTLTGNTICTTTTTEINLFSCEATFDPLVPESINHLKVVATKGTKVIESEADTILHIDTLAPSLVAFRNLNTNHSDIVTKYLCQNGGFAITQLQANITTQSSFSFGNVSSFGLNSNSIWCDDGSGLPNGFYRQGGDTVQVELEGDEELAYGKIINQNEKFRYELNPVENAGNRPTSFSPYFAVNGLFQIEGYADQGSYDVEVEISDRAGNISTTTATYFVDNVVPNAPVQDVNFWGKLTAFDRRVLDQQTPSDPNDPNSPLTNPTGIPSNMQPANNRLLEIDNQQNYVIKDNSVVFYGMAEKGTYPILSVNNTDVLAMETDLINCTTQSFVDGVLVDNQSATAPDGSIVQDQNHCLWKIEVGFEALYSYLAERNSLNTTSQGTKPGATSKAEGVYLIQWRNEDSSGNRSEYTRQYLLEYDKTKPQFFSIDKASSPKFNPIVDWQSNGATTLYSDGRGNLPPVTNQISLTLDSTTEQLADVEYYLIDNAGQVVSNQYQKFINPRNQKHTISFNLGDKTADQNGQSGLAQDGYYQICYNSGDSADNEIGIKCFAIERDTLTPNAPNFSANLNFVYKQEPYTISGVVSGEQYTKSSLLGNLGRSGTKSGTLKTLSVNNDSDWETTFTFCSNLSDRATNTSGNTCRTVRTPVRPPRGGECSLTEGVKNSVAEKIKNGEKPNASDAGISRSCTTYEPDLVNQIINDAVGEFIKIQQEVANCTQNNTNNGMSNADALAACGAKEKLGTKLADGFLNDLDTRAAENKAKQDEAQSCIQRNLESGQSASDAIDGCGLGDLGMSNDQINNLKDNIQGSIDEAKKQAEDAQRKADEAKCEGWGCLWKGITNTVTGVGDFFVSLPDLAKGAFNTVSNFIGDTANALTSLNANALNVLVSGGQALFQTVTSGDLSLNNLGNNFNNNLSTNKQIAQNMGIPMNDPMQDLAQITKAAAVVAATVAVVALCIVAAPFVAAGAVALAGAASALVGGGVIGAVVGAGAVALAGSTITTIGFNLGSAGISGITSGSNFDTFPPSIGFDGKAAGETLEQGFCGPAKESNLTNCAAYTTGQIIGGTALELGTLGAGKLAGSVGSKITKVVGQTPLSKGLTKIGATITTKIDDVLKPVTTKIDDALKPITKPIANGLDNLSNYADDLGKKIVGDDAFNKGKNILNPIHNPNAADDIAKLDKTITNNIDNAIADNIDDIKKTNPSVNEPDFNPNSPDSPFKNPKDYEWVDEFGVPCNPLSTNPVKVSKVLTPWDYLVAFVSPIGVSAAGKDPGAGCFSVGELVNIYVDKRKFSDYIFNKQYDDGKEKVFADLGYSKKDSDLLTKIYTDQAKENYTKGNYILGIKDEYGQRITIEIKLDSIGLKYDKTSYLKSGWMVKEDGSLSLNTPFSGFSK
jgi:hypothetical protein